MQDRPAEAERFDVVLLAGPARVAEADDAIVRAGGRRRAVLAWEQADELIVRPLGRPVLALEAEGVTEAVLAEALPLVAEAADLLDLNVVAVTGRDRIDQVWSALPGPGVQILCDPTLAERITALAIAGAGTRAATLADRWREGEAERLQKLNDEVARIAELLARLASREPDQGGGSDVGDRHLAFGYAPPADDVDPQAIRQTIRARRLRDAFFGGNLFEDPAWDMLLDLYAAHLEGGRVSVSSLCIAAAVAPTTALRWISKMTDLGLFDRRPDPVDRRRAFLALSSRALKGMAGYVAAVRRTGLPIA